MTAITKSLLSDFGGSIKLSQLHEEISSSVPELSKINLDGDVVEIVFESSLDTGQLVTVNSKITDHTPDYAPPKIKFFTHIGRRESTKNTNYTRLGGSFKYQGSKRIGLINYIEVVAYKQSSVTSYDIRIYDKTNKTVLVEKTGITNSVAEAIDLGEITNIPTKNAILEIQARRVGGSGSNRVYIDQALIYYDN